LTEQSGDDTNAEYDQRQRGTQKTRELARLLGRSEQHRRKLRFVPKFGDETE